MSVPTTDDLVLKRHLQELLVLGLVGSTAIQASAMAFVWGSWTRVLTIGASWLSMGAINWAITAFAFPRVGSEGTEDLRLLPNVALVCVSGHASGWSLGSLLFLPFATVLVGGLQTGRPTGRLVLMICSVSLFAIFDHAVPSQVACCAGMAAFWHFVGLAHTRFARTMLAEREGNISALASAHAALQSAQQRAIAQEKLASIGLLAAGVAHEINNPMCYVTANLNELSEDLAAAAALPPELIVYRDEILPDTLDGVRRVNSIVSDLRRFARGEPEQSQEFDLAAELESVARISKSQLKTGQTLQVETNSRPMAWGMARQIGQVALNLLVNAIEASPNDGAITVCVGSSRDEATFSIRDRGTGMTPEVVSHLFLPFFTTKAVGKGTGLGLSVAHGIIAAHRGRIEVSSAPGEGTCIAVFLPQRSATV